jgi:signal transduction histidine kinase
MAARLAKAVPSVVDADRAAVMVYDAESDALRMAGWFGYRPGLGASLDSLVIRRRDSPEISRFFRNPEPGYYTPDSEDRFVRSLLARYGSAGIFVVPIIARGDLLGVITADHLPGKPPLEVTDAIRARMAGLADQAATALENARLLAREREAVATLQEADRLKSEFLAIVSHELRTPLAVIVGGAKTLRSQGHRLEKDDHEQLLDAVIRRSEQLRALVEDLLQTTRDFKLQLARVDLSQLAADAVRDVCSTEAEASVSCDLPGPLPVVVDPSRIRQVLDNLLTNAIKYAPGSPIEVRAASVDGSVEVSVSDRGPGMTNDQAAKAFEPFYQGSKDPERWTGGVGLGLYIARRIVEAHGGTIRIESRPGEGTAVHLSLPTADIRPVTEPTAAAAEKPSRTAARS